MRSAARKPRRPRTAPWSHVGQVCACSHQRRPYIGQRSPYRRPVPHADRRQVVKADWHFHEPGPGGTSLAHLLRRARRQAMARCAFPLHGILADHVNNVHGVFYGVGAVLYRATYVIQSATCMNVQMFSGCGAGRASRWLRHGRAGGVRETDAPLVDSDPARRAPDRDCRPRRLRWRTG